MLEFIAKYAEVAVFFVPLGIIGIWRWSVWLVRKFISFFYRTPRGNYSASLGIVTPVYNEDPKYFRMALESWKQNQPDEIIAVIDYTDERNIAEFKNFAKTFAGARLIVTPVPGKRQALADGIQAARTEIVALVDSDTIWSENIAARMLAPFADPEVGGVGPRQDVLEPKTLAQKLFKIRLDLRFYQELAYLMVLGDAVTCLSGRTALYRREALLPHLHELANEKFLGHQLISGDDKTLTRLVQGAGWKTRFLRDTVVYTPGFADMKTFLKQILRWSRNSWRSDIETLSSSWVWKREKPLAFHMLDRFVPPFTLMLGPAYFFISLYFGYWEIAVVLFVWWMVSRAIKIFPHLREKPGDVLILPAYVVMTFVEALIKIYALLTITENEWSTRWHKSRVEVVHFFKRLSSVTATLSIVVGLFFVVYSYKNYTLQLAQTEKKLAKETQQIVKVPKPVPSILTPEIPRVSAEVLAQTKTDLMNRQQDNPYGYYVVNPNDTMQILRNRYNLAATASVLDAQKKTALPRFAPLQVGQQVAIAVGDMQRPLDAQVLLRSDYLRKPPRVTYDALANTVFLGEGGSIATLTKIRSALVASGQPQILEQTSPGEWILRANLYVGKNVTLILNSPSVAYLKLKSDKEKFVWVRSEAGNILVSGSKITSWDEQKAAPDMLDTDGRAYLTAKNSGRMDILNAELAYLGYEGFPRRGGPFGASYGVSWKIKNNGFKKSLLTGVVENSKFHHNFFGLYTFGATGMIIRNSEFYDNINYGIDPHDDSNNMLIENNKTYRNGRHGIILSKRCFGNIIRNNISYDNRLHGIMLDRSSNSNLVEKNVTYGNTDGIALYESADNLILNNEIRNNKRGLRVNQNSANNYFAQNILTGNSRGFYLYSGATKNILVSNNIQGSEVGVTLMAATQNILYDNFQPAANQKDGRVTPDAVGNSIW